MGQGPFERRNGLPWAFSRRKRPDLARGVQCVLPTLQNRKSGLFVAQRLAFVPPERATTPFRQPRFKRDFRRVVARQESLGAKEPLIGE